MLLYMFMKINKLGAGTESEINHIKMCMNIFDTVKYGVVTDGNEIVIINDDFEEVDDIPSFNKRMISSVNLV